MTGAADIPTGKVTENGKTMNDVVITDAPKGRFDGVLRPYSQKDVDSLRGSLKIEHSLARHGANKLWELMQSEPYVHSLGALTGGQAVQMVRAGLKAIYVSGWQVAADANAAMQVYPDQSIYPSNSVPLHVKRINNALQRADHIEVSEGGAKRDWFVPIIADAEAGFGGPLNAYEMMKFMIEAGAACVHYEDQLASEKKCGHLGGKVLIPTSQFLRNLVAARLAADVADTPTLIIARTDAHSAALLTSDIDEVDRKFCTGERTPEGYYRVTPGVKASIARGLAYAPYADMLWMETSTPSLDEAREFADAIHAKYPGKLLAYNCSPSFNWERHLDKATIDKYCDELGKMGFKYQFVTLAGFHQLNYGMFELASGFAKHGMKAFSEMQQLEFAAEKRGYTAIKHQREVGTGYFDCVSNVITAGASSTLALKGSTEASQFHE
jgi:isocitrate lyase